MLWTPDEARFLEVCVLASRSTGQDSHGYQIVKDVPAILNPTESTLYRSSDLKRRGRHDSIAEHNKRLRKYHRITEAGVRHIDEFLRERDDVSIYDMRNEVPENEQDRVCRRAAVSLLGKLSSYEVGAVDSVLLGNDRRPGGRRRRCEQIAAVVLGL